MPRASEHYDLFCPDHSTAQPADYGNRKRRSGKHKHHHEPFMNEHPHIVKADGSIEPFDPARLVFSLERAGASARAAERIAETITNSLVPGSTSKEIYGRAFALLRKEGRPVAARYAMRRALLELGPSGHPFEDFVSRLLQAEGWHVETRKMIQGKCVVHETDFYASHPGKGEYLAAELKYHNDPAYKTDLKIALYVKSRFDDIFACDPQVQSCPIDRGLLVTNTKFTSEAIKYAECAGVELLGWSYPQDASLFARMAKAKIYPVTALTSLTRAEKRLLINERTISVDEIVSNRDRLNPLHLPSERVGVLMAEADGLLTHP